ncbi:sugar ABC transporter permease [Agromyces atrinae]|uniref:carbohydrate ABC transporter permease n=1 Tax=Agromyces atrinae TaxID=592376 RepID=UPI001F56C096|nr:sugar ABC transporter permease [Agromyces atrinae]MCI2956234.1 sugar ABC transporter permease [Agromyces atrinae]
MTTAPAIDREVARTRQRRAPSAFQRRRKLAGWAYAAPTAIFALLLFVVPLFTVGQMSLSEWSLLGGDKGFNAPENYVGLADNPLLWPSIVFTVKYTVIVTVIMLALALGIALIVQEQSRWNSIVRTAILVPSALGLASASLLFWGLYSPNIGPISPILEWLGIIDEPISFLGTPDAALWSTVFLIIWRYTGFYMLVLMVGLQGIPGDVYEAARIDGASRWQTFRSITLPLLRPSIALTLILCVTGSLLAFDQFFILTKGGPDNSTITIVQLIYREAFQRFDLGAAAALSVVVLLALVVINLVQFRALRDKE